MSTQQDSKSDGRGWVKYLAVATSVAFIGLLVYGLLAKATDTTIDDALSRGEAPSAPGFGLPVLDPGTVSGGAPGGAAFGDGNLDLQELQGTPVVLNFWASWCIPCRDEAPVLERGWRDLGPRGVIFIGLNMQDLTEDALKFVDEFGVTYPTIREPTSDVADIFGATGIPETYFIDAQGRVVGHAIGALDQSQLEAGAKAALSGQVVGTIAGGAFRPQK